MRKTPTLYFQDERLQQEYEKVSRYFDITNRATPSPYFPDKAQRLQENTLLQSIKSINNMRGLSLYIHIPFCEKKCSFCDLYCFQLPTNKRNILDEYIGALEHEIRFWGHLFDWSSRPVTTIHFGGGSPLIMTPKQMERLFVNLNKYYKILKNTEIAIEITSSQMTQENFYLLKKFNISRIHIGVQTLSDPIRNIIGRREPAQNVIAKLKQLSKKDFIVSVDMLYGLPMQTGDGFKNDLHEFIELNVDGFALYELQISNALRRIIDKNSSYKIDKPLSYKMLLIGKNILNNSGYRNVFFNHYGNHRDKNLYFTYPMRGEDCLAFGTIADARLGNVVYRHKKFNKYMDGVLNDEAGIDFGFIESDRRRAIRGLEIHLMSTTIPKESIDLSIEEFGTSFKGIFELWQEAHLVESVNEGSHFQLTGSGCYLLSTMIDQIRRLDM